MKQKNTYLIISSIFTIITGAFWLLNTLMSIEGKLKPILLLPFVILIDGCTMLTPFTKRAKEVQKSSLAIEGIFDFLFILLTLAYPDFRTSIHLGYINIVLWLIANIFTLLASYTMYVDEKKEQAYLCQNSENPQENSIGQEILIKKTTTPHSITKNNLNIPYEDYDEEEDEDEEEDNNLHIPDMSRRANLERQVIKSFDELELENHNSSNFVWTTNRQIQKICLEHNLPRDWISFTVSNVPLDELNIELVVLKDKDNQYINFISDFCKKFKSQTQNKGSNYISIYSEQLFSNKENVSNSTEEQFQEKLKEELSNYFSNPDSTYFKIIDFIRNYKF